MGFHTLESLRRASEALKSPNLPAFPPTANPNKRHLPLVSRTAGQSLSSSAAAIYGAYFRLRMGTQQLSTRSPFNLSLSPFYLGQFSCLPSRGPCVILLCQIRYNFRVKLCLPDVPGSFGRKFVSGLMNDGAGGQRMSQFGGGKDAGMWPAGHERPRIPFPFPSFFPIHDPLVTHS